MNGHMPASDGRRTSKTEIPVEQFATHAVSPNPVVIQESRHVDNDLSQTKTRREDNIDLERDGFGPSADGNNGDLLNNPENLDDGWGPGHPCYPHRNPHVPIASALYHSTRIIRIPRDYMLNGDLSPAYSNVYPDILEPHMNESQFRSLITKVNDDLRDAFDPWKAINILDGLLGFVSGWILEDVKLGVEGITASRRKVSKLENWIDDTLNNELRKTGAKVWPLRRTGFMNLDIQIPNPLPDSEEDANLQNHGSTISPPETSPGPGPSF